jgi:hypothetical protein
LALNFVQDGVEIVEHVASDAVIAELSSEFGEAGVSVGARPFTLSETARALIQPGGRLSELAREFAGCPARPVRVLAFDKTPQVNWHLPWHQDRVIAVRERTELPDFKNWTVKNGQHHVEPPPSLLEMLFSLRLHLDDNDAENRALKVIRGSHRLGRMSDGQVRELAAVSTPEICSVSAGGVVAMKALTIHASDASRTNRRRRVLHVDYCWGELPHNLHWALAA